MIWDVLHYVSLAGMWFVIVDGMRRARYEKQRRANEELWCRTKDELVKTTGLTPLQIQVALDEGNAAFNRRLAELQRSARA